MCIFEVRKYYPAETLSNLYDPDLMPVALRKAHKKLDDAVDRIYSKTQFVCNRTVTYAALL